MIRKRSFDTLKGLSCIAVVFIHVLFPEPLRMSIKSMSRFAVPVFLMISGFFFITEKGEYSVESCVRKAKHTMALLLNAGLFYAAFCMAFNRIADHEWEIISFIKSRVTAGRLVRFFLTNDPLAYPHLWFLLALLYIYLCFMLFGKGKVTLIHYWLGLALLLGYSILQEFGGVLNIRRSILIPGSSERIYVYNLFIFRGLPFFLIGTLLRRLETRIVQIKINHVVLIIIATVSAASSALEYTWTNDTQYFIGSILAAVLLMIVAINKENVHFPFLEYLGRELSMYVYVFHIAIQKSMFLYFQKIHISNRIIVIWTMPVLVLFVTICICYLFKCIREGIGSIIKRF